MPKSPGKSSSQSLKWLLQSILFFILFFLYLWLYVDLRLIYHGAGVITNFPVFYKGRAFFMPFLSYPGGPVEYLSAFLSQFFYFSWAGALVVTVQAWLLSICMDYLLKAAKLSRFRLVCFVLPMLLLVIYTRYAYHFDTTVALLVALLFACLYLKVTLSRTTTLSCFSTFLFLSVILYYLAGGAFLLFAVVCAAYELIFRFRWKISLFYLLSAAAVPYILGLFVFRVSILDAFCSSLPFSWKIIYYEARRREVTIVYLMYLFSPLALLVFGLLQILWKRLYSLKNRAPKRQRKKSSGLPSKIFSWYRHSPKLKWAVELLLLLVVAGSVVFFCRNENLRIRFKVDYYAYHKMWPELLMSARHNPKDPFVAQAINRALYHTGRLGYDMFTWPQDSDYLILSDKKYKWMYWQIFDLFIDLGVVNMAENALTECLEGIGSRPMVLQRLALINMVKGNSDSARIYLGALGKTLFHADWANSYLDRLQIDPDLASDKYIQHLRSLCLDKDVPIYTLYKEKTLLWLLERNSQNRMAFEYLMAWYMLNRNLGKFVLNLERLQDFGYRELPTHYEEAAIIYIYGTKKPLNLSGYQPNPQKRRQIEDFTRIINSDKYKGNKQAASEELAKKYCNTYFYYYMYTPSGSNK
ncbi:MAG: hypothetical protein JXA81_02265 [Sedimentisphaerales bacterium]|nr:hypothetical protein [Sedimentisphaerales bacterium]